MAYVSNILTQSSTSGAASYALTLPPHVADDIILVCVSADGGGTLSATWGGNSTGGAQIGSTQVSTTNLCSAVFAAKATGAAATCSINMGSADGIQVHMLIIKDADITTWIDASAASVQAAATEVTANALSTTVADCLLLYYLAIDQATTTPSQAHSRPGPSATMHFLDSSDNGGTTVTTLASGAIGWYFQRSAGAIPRPVWDISNSEITASFSIAIRNKSGGRIPPYVDDYIENGRQLMTGSWWVSATTRNNQNFPTALTYSNVGPNGAGQATTYDAAASVVDAGLNPYSAALNSTPAATATNMAGFQCNFPTTTIDMSSGWIVGAFHASTSKMALFNQGSIAQGGTLLVIGQGANYHSYRVMGRDNQDGNGKDFSIISVKPNQTQTRYGYSATAPTITAIDKILILHKGHNATGAFYYTDFHLFQRIVLAGGDSVVPIDAQGVADIAKFCRLPVVKKLGASELNAYVPIQVGGGDAVNFQIDAGALQFPRIADESKKEINYHGDNGAIGISYAGKSGDVIKHTNSIITSPSPYYWDIHASATSAATWDFSGTTIVGANVTLRPVVSFLNMAFSSCAFVATGGSTISNCKFTNSKITCTSPANAALVSNSSITKTTGTQHGIEITGTAADITLTGLTFTGFAGSNGSTGNEAIFVNIASGSMTISITGGGSTPTIRTAGATVTVQNAVTVKVTVKDSKTLAPIENARILLEKTSDGTDIMSGLSDASGVLQISYAYTVDTPVTGKARRATTAYGTLYKESPISGSITTSGFDVTILMNSDE